MEKSEPTLLLPQRQLAYALLNRLWTQAETALTEQSLADGRNHEAEGSQVAMRHPYDDLTCFNTYTISGSRGAGKSTVLKTVRYLLPYLGTWGLNWQPRRAEIYGGWRPYPDDVVAFFKRKTEEEQEAAKKLQKQTEKSGAVKPAGLSPPPQAEAAELLPDNVFKPHSPLTNPPRGFVGQQTALVLPIIDPSQFESERHTVMEQVIAHLSFFIKDRLETVMKSGPSRRGHASAWHADPDDAAEGDKTFSRLRQCLIKLQGEIAKGWVFAQEFGQRMLQDDSASFDEFVKSRSERSIDAALRHRRWRETLDEVLDCLNYRLLVVCFDDCDLAPQNTLDVLDTVRVYLSSPRIGVIMATEIEELRQNLRKSRLASIERMASILTMTGKSNQFKGEIAALVQNEYKEANLFLDKIVPVNNRFYLHRGVPEISAEFSIGALIPQGIGEPKKRLLEDNYNHMFSLLTQRQIEGILNLMRRDGRNTISVEDMIAVVSPAAEENSVFSIVTARPGRLIVKLELANNGYFSIEIETNGPISPTGNIWIRSKPDTRTPTQEPRFDRANALRGTFLAFLIDCRISDETDTSLIHYPVEVKFMKQAPLVIAPLFKKDWQRLIADAEGLLADLSSYTNLPRNCRSLVRAADLFLSHENRRPHLGKSEIIEFLDKVFDAQANPQLRPGKLPLLMLIFKSNNDHEFIEDLHYRFYGAIVSIVNRKTEILIEPFDVIDMLRNDRIDLYRITKCCATLSRRLTRSLFESRTALGLLVDAALIFTKIIGIKENKDFEVKPENRLKFDWTPPDEDEIDQMISNNSAGFGKISEFFLAVSRESQSAIIATENAADATRDLLLASLGPIAILHNCFGSDHAHLQTMVKNLENIFKNISIIYKNLKDHELTSIFSKLKPNSENFKNKIEINVTEKYGEFSLSLDYWPIIVAFFDNQPDPDQAIKNVADFLRVPEAVLRVVLEQF